MINQENVRKLSVVIPSLAGTNLANTVDCILSSSIEGFDVETIIVVPIGSESQAIELLNGRNVKIIGVTKSGQVFQRSTGFKAASGEIVLQLDDDMLFDNNLLKNLFQRLRSMGPGNVVAPLIKDQLTGFCVERSYPNRLKRTYKDLVDFFIFGLPWGDEKYGKYSPYCGARVVKVQNLLNDLNEVQWLPGGIVMGYRGELVLEDFYPLNGKAFAEDLIHSQIRKAQGLRHWIAKDLIATHCSLPAVNPKKNKDEVISLFHDLKKYACVSNKLGGGRLRIWISVAYQFFCGLLFLAKKNIKK